MSGKSTGIHGLINGTVGSIALCCWRGRHRHSSFKCLRTFWTGRNNFFIQTISGQGLNLKVQSETSVISACVSRRTFRLPPC